MSFKKISFIVLAFLFFSCDSGTFVSSHTIIPEKKMVAILFDVHFNDAVINSYNNQDVYNIFLSKEHYEKHIFAKHQVTDSLFRLNIQYYTLNNSIKEIYIQVLDSLNNLKINLEKEKVLERKKRK